MSQFGLNFDSRRVRADNLTKAVTLQGFKGWFARIYDKKELGVVRTEIHSNEERSLENLLALLSGGLSQAHGMSNFGAVASSMNNLYAQNRDMMVRIGKLTDVTYLSSEKICALEKSVDEQNRFNKMQTSFEIKSESKTARYLEVNKKQFSKFKLTDGDYKMRKKSSKINVNLSEEEKFMFEVDKVLKEYEEKRKIKVLT